MMPWIRRHPVSAHFILSVAIASAVVAVALVRAVLAPASAGALGRLFETVYGGPGYMNLLTIAAAIPGEPDLLTVFVFAAAPTLAALLLTARGVRESTLALLARLKPVGPDGEPGRALSLYAGLLAVYAAGLFAFDWVAGPGVNAWDRLAGFGLPVLFGAAIGLFLDEGGTLEELGWRGFAWPALLAFMRSPLNAALVLGLLHWAWHLPREVFTILGGAPLGAFLIGQLTFLVLTIALAIVAGYCVNRTGGSVLPAIMVHGGTNVWSKAMGEYVSPTFGILDLRTLIVGLAAILIIVFARKSLGLKRER